MHNRQLSPGDIQQLESFYNDALRTLNDAVTALLRYRANLELYAQDNRWHDGSCAASIVDMLKLARVIFEITR